MSSIIGPVKTRRLTNFFWTEGDLGYKRDVLQNSISATVQEKFEFAKKICILSSRQIGKSYWVITFVLEYLIKNPGTIARVIGPTREAVDEIVGDNLNVIINDVPDGFISKSTTKNRWNLFNGSSLRLGALERQYVDKNRGGNASLIVYEECGFVSGDDFLYGVNSVIGPQLIRSKGHEIFVSSPSEQPDHPLHTEIAPKCEELGTLFNYMVFESPSIQESAIVEAAERSGTIIDLDFVYEVMTLSKTLEKILPEDVHKIADQREIFLSDGFMREFMAEVIRPSDLMVIPKYYPKTCFLDMKIPAVANWSVVIDWGGVRDKTAAYLYTYEFNSDLDIFVDEKIFDSNTSTDKIVESLKEWDETNPVLTKWADVPGQLQVDLNSEHDYQIQVPPKSDWLSSVNTMAARFSTNKIRVSSSCPFLRKSIKAGMFNKTRTDFARTNELGHMDSLAAIMYGIRCQNKENPYQSGVYSPSSTRFDNPESMQDAAGLESLGGKGFGKYAK